MQGKQRLCLCRSTLTKTAKWTSLCKREDKMESLVWATSTTIWISIAFSSRRRWYAQKQKLLSTVTIWLAQPSDISWRLLKTTSNMFVWPVNHLNLSMTTWTYPTFIRESAEAITILNNSTSPIVCRKGWTAWNSLHQSYQTVNFWSMLIQIMLKRGTSSFSSSQRRFCWSRLYA